jgi:hypothetical protein
MIVNLLRKISAQLAEVIKILRQPEDFTTEDNIVKDMTKKDLQAEQNVKEAEQRLPSDKTTNQKE